MFKRLRPGHRLLLLTLLLLPGLLLAYYPKKRTDRPPFYGEGTILGMDLESQSLDQRVAKKKSFVFYFLPTCPHCQSSAPTVARLANTYGKELQFIGLASASSRLSDVREFKELYQLPFDVYQDGGSFGSRNELRSFPAFVLTDGSATPAEAYTSFSKDMDVLLEVAVVRFLGRDPLPLLKPDTYYGSEVCSTCHVDEYRSWGVNHHATAMWSLEKINKTTDPKCIGCHVVGYGKPGGYTDLETTQHLSGVGCEACHGPAGGHNQVISVEEKLARAKLTPVQKYGALCVSCHDQDHSIGFDAAKGIPLVGHHFDRTIPEPEFVARRASLLEGSAARPLLEFPAGVIQGADTCKGCHPGIHASWTSDPHGKAMESLKQKGKTDDPACVKCHATTRDPAHPEQLAAYLPGGVQCESCHGPAEAHVKAGGGRGNIVALTSSCPVCVIATVCGECHTKDQDPDFDLEKALAKVRAGHKKH